jgi:hypothetical protein
MSYTYLLEQGEESSAASFLDIPQSVLSRLNLIAGKSCCKGSGTESCQSFQSGMMSPPSTEVRGEEKSMSSAEGFHAPTFPVPVKARESKVKKADSGQKWPESLAKYDPNTHSWRTHQCLLFEDSTESLETFPNWGMMHDGECWERTMLALPTVATESGLWATPVANSQMAATIPALLKEAQRLHPRGQWSLATQVAAEHATGNKMWATPSARDWKDTPGMARTAINADGTLRNREDQLARQVYAAENATGGRMNPDWIEWLMGWPISWTESAALATDKFQQWRHSHGEFLEVEND